MSLTKIFYLRYILLFTALILLIKCNIIDLINEIRSQLPIIVNRFNVIKLHVAVFICRCNKKKRQGKNTVLLIKIGQLISK